MEFSQYAWPMSAFATGVAAWFAAMLLVLTTPLHGRFSASTLFNVQDAHTDPTPRIGGLAIYASVTLGILLTSGEARGILLSIVLAGTPAFAFGLLEDLTQRVSVGSRLFATLGSGVLGWFITGITITDVNLPWIDALLLWPPLAVAFTAFAVSGVANAFNIIDGFNGLAAGTAMLVITALGLLSLHLGDVQMANVCVLLAAAVFGFLLVNWPLGKIFLGDGGAYFVGFGVAWIAVAMLHRHPEVSAWCPLLICAYPVCEVVFSMLRRRKRALHIGHPDRVHLHSLVKRRVVRQRFPTLHTRLRNSITGAMMWIMTLLPALWAILFFDNTLMLALGLAVYALSYEALYARLVWFRWSRPRSWPLPVPAPASTHPE